MAEKSSIERTLETLVDLVDLARKQSVTSFDKVNASIERQNVAIDGHLRLSEAQSVNIAELTRLATKLIDRAA